VIIRFAQAWQGQSGGCHASLARDGALNGLGRAIQEIGRIAKTLFLLEYVNDEATQRRVHLVLTHQETRHSLAREVLHGNQGEIRQHYKVGMESQLGALGFVVNIIVLWNTLYTQAALELVEAIGDEVQDEDVVRLSPLKWSHINVHGKY
jgi:TnpA family transposase